MPVHAIIDNPFGDTVVAVYKRKTILTNSQILTLPTSGVEIIPAPGEGRVIILNGAYAVVNSLSGGYVVASNSSLVLMIGNEYVSSVAKTQSLFTDPQQRSIQFPIPYCTQDGSGAFTGVLSTVPFAASITDLANIALKLKDDWNGVADYTGGDPANTLEVTVFYSIVDL